MGQSLGPYLEPRGSLLLQQTGSGMIKCFFFCNSFHVLVLFSFSFLSYMTSILSSHTEAAQTQRNSYKTANPQSPIRAILQGLLSLPRILHNKQTPQSLLHLSSLIPAAAVVDLSDPALCLYCQLPSNCTRHAEDPVTSRCGIACLKIQLLALTPIGTEGFKRGLSLIRRLHLFLPNARIQVFPVTAYKDCALGVEEDSPTDA